jgi:MFS family permease
VVIPRQLRFTSARKERDGASGSMFAALRIRNFRLFFSGQLVSSIGNWLTVVAQTLFVLKLTDSGVALGLLAGAQFGPVLVLGAWAGLVTDRSDKRRLLLFVQVIAMAQSVALATLAFSNNPSVIAVYVIALVGGVTAAFENPARRSLVVEMVPESETRNAVSLNSAVMSGSRVVGPALAGVLIGVVGFGWCFLIDAFSYVAVLVGLVLMRTSELRQVTIAPRGRGQVRAGVRYARGVPAIWAPLVMMTVIGTLSYNFPVVFPLFATRDLHGGDGTFTMLFALTSAGALIGALNSARSRSLSVRSVSLAAIGYGVGMTAVAVSPNVTTAVLASLLLGVGSATFMTAATSLIHTTADSSMRGRLSALESMVFLGTTPIGGPLVGWVCEQFGARYGFLLGAFAALGAGAWGCSRRVATHQGRSMGQTRQS